MKFIGAILICVALAGCASAGPNLTAAQAAQANFNQACKFAGGAAATAGPLVPLLASKLGDDGMLALQSFLLAIATTCGKPLDINNSDAVIQNVYDIAGQVIALVVKAQGS